MQRVYIETTIPSFLSARQSRDLVFAGKQITTQLWWETRRSRFELFVSPFVIEEAGMGNTEAAQRRLEVLAELAVLGIDREVARIAQGLVDSGVIPSQVATDASHLAVATRHGMDFFLTWNQTHLANAQTLPRVMATLRKLGYEPPVVCTPDELTENANE